MLTALLTAVRGFAMGAADIVPGVSGGTIALVFGIYERLVASIRAGSSAIGSLLRGDLGDTRMWLGRVEWGFILPLGAGILIAILALAHVIEQLLIEQPVVMAATFVGLVAGSVVIAGRLIRSPRAIHVVLVAVVGVAVFILLGLTAGTTEEAVEQIAQPALWAFFGAGAIAICAMILPGVSGSFLLVVMGMYGPILTAVTDRDLVALGVFAIGAIVGLALFSQLLDRALHRHHDVMIAALIGLMAGSLRVLWPWPLGVDSTELGAPDGDIAIAVVMAAVGFVVVVAIGWAAQSLEDEVTVASFD